MVKPHRKIETKIEIDADDKESLIAALNQLLFEAQTDKFPMVSSINVGWSWSWNITTNLDMTQTHDGWAQELNNYLESIRPHGIA